MYLFDTDVITNVLKKMPSPYLIHHLEQISPKEQFISAITVAEIVYGVQKSRRPEYHLKNLEEVLLTEVAVLDFGMDAAYLAGKIRAQLEKSGMRLAGADIQIAAIAMMNDLTLISGNIKHFSRIPVLKIENWLTKERK
jgi:predicted nucleic acid-binding protein